MTSDLAARRRFLGLNDRSQARLALLGPLVDAALPSALADLRARLLEVGDSRFNQRDLDRAAPGQLSHWRALAAGRLDEDYLERSQQIAEVHARIGLEPQWYVDAQGLVLGKLVREVLRLAPDHGVDATALAEGLEDLVLAVGLDIDLTLSSLRTIVRRD